MIKNIKEKFIKTIIKWLVKRVNKNPIVVDTNLGNIMLTFPKEGGMESYIPGHPFPFPGMPDEKIVNQVSILKRMIPVACKYYWCILKELLPDPKLYSKPVRELYRVISLIRESEGDTEMRGQWTEIRDILCMMLEADDTYRFRFMEMMNHINLKEFEFTEADKYWAEKKWKFKWSWQEK